MIHMLKLSVGSDGVETLTAWQKSRASAHRAGHLHHVTRMWPRREAELTDGGSIYWVIQGLILARQRVLALDEVVGDDGIRRCALRLDPDLHRTEPAARRPFQGWRYLSPADAPADLGGGRGVADLPPALIAALAEIGVR